MVRNKKRLTFIQSRVDIIEFEVLGHQLYRLWIEIICVQFVNIVDLFEIPNRPEPSCCKCFKYLDSFWFLSFGRGFLSKHLDVFSNDRNGDVSVEFLDGIVEDSATCLIDFICDSLPATLRLNEAFTIFLKFLFNVQNLGLSFFEYFEALSSCLCNFINSLFHIWFKLKV